MDGTYYDSAGSVAKMLGSLRDFNALETAGYAAGYQRQERLQGYLILGRWVRDTCGNLGKITGDFVPADHLKLPPVIPLQDLFVWAEAAGFSNVSYSHKFVSDIPPAKQRCAYCHQRWTIHNCHHVVIQRDEDVVSLAPFTGKTLAEVKRVFGRKQSVLYRLQSETFLRNDRFIDLTPLPDYKTLKVNEGGWVGEREGIGDDYAIQPGDEAYSNLWRFYHPSCNRKHLAEVQEAEFLKVFAQAGYPPKRLWLKVVKNQYCGCDHCAPWFEVKTPIGVFTIGWRKRVINIIWPHGKNFLSFFEGEDVTKGDEFIHAWGYEKAENYLGRILRAETAPKAGGLKEVADD